MKLLYAQSVKSTINYDCLETRRGDLINLNTGEIPYYAQEGNPWDIISRVYGNGTEVIEIKGAVTDMVDVDNIIYKGQKYYVTENQKSCKYGLWDFIKCHRHIPKL